MSASIEFDQQMSSWINGIDNEVKFWDMWLSNSEEQYVFARKQRLGQSLPIEFPEIIPLLKPHDRILDCGSSLASTIGDTLPNGDKIELIPADPLAPIYDVLLNKYKLKAYAKTQFAMVEFLDDIFVPGSFDMACMSNSLDHTYDPILGIKQLLNMVKKDGYVFLSHNQNEAVNANYAGFHQWNMDFDDDKFIIWNKSTRYNINEMLAGIADVLLKYDKYQGKPDNGAVIIVLIKKKTDALFNVNAEKIRVLNFFVRAFAYLMSRTYKIAVKSNNPPIFGEVSKLSFKTGFSLFKI